MSDWQAALQRAMTEGVTVRTVTRDHDHPNAYRIQVNSASDPSACYQVTLIITGGTTLSRCTCPAGRFRRPCKHQAVARTLLAITGNQWPSLATTTEAEQ